jgi:uncharacterized protein (DUF1697 family)
MGTFVALVRGVGPTNPNMRNAKLAAVLKRIGCSDIAPILASGNLVFRSPARSTRLLEAKIERAFHDQLELSCDVVVRSRAELVALVKRDPFHGAEHGKAWYLVVTFRKDGGAPICTKLARANMDGPEFMARLEEKHGNHITTRTWNTVLKIVAKMDAIEREESDPG